MASQFAPNEVRDILIAWAVLSIALVFQNFLDLVRGIAVSTDIEVLAASAIAAATGFIIHEMGHKFVAMGYGYIAHFRLWQAGLLLLLITAIVSSLSGGLFVFGAPGAVYITPAAAAGAYYGYGYYSTNYRQTNPKKENLWISVAGPGLNLLFALLFFGVLLAPSGGTFLLLVARYAFTLNLGLGAFNMIPIPPLDGYKIFRGNILVGLAIALPLWIGAIYLFYL